MEYVDYIKPTRVLSCSSNVNNVEHLFLSNYSHNMLCPPSYTSIKGKGYLVLDFEKEYFGGIRISLGHNLPTINKPYLRIRFGESLMEANSELGYKNSTNDHSTRDMTVYMSSFSDMSWGSTGFRFVRLDFLEDINYQIENITLAFHHEEEPSLIFKSSNPELDAIIEAAKRTLWINKQDGIYFEGAKRDQHIWAGDLYPELTAAIYSFSSIDNIKNCIKFLIDNYPENTWYNEIPSYNAWLILTLLRYFELTGDVNETYLRCISSNLVMFKRLIENDFVLDNVDKWGLAFFDWSTLDTPSSAYGIRYLFALTLNKVIESSYVSNSDKELAESLLNRLDNVEGIVTNSKAVNSLELLLNKYDKKPLIDQIKQDGCKGFTVFLTCLILEALANNNELEFAYKSMLDYFGGMLEIGGTILFEEFNLSDLDNSCKLDEMPAEGKLDFHGDHGEQCYAGYRKSLCHGWACGVIPFVIEHLVGLRIEKGKYVKINPNILDLDFIEADIPTSKGNIHINIKQVNGVTDYDVRLPEHFILERINNG